MFVYILYFIALAVSALVLFMLAVFGGGALAQQGHIGIADALLYGSILLDLILLVVFVKGVRLHKRGHKPQWLPHLMMLAGPVACLLAAIIGCLYALVA